MELSHGNVQNAQQSMDEKEQLLTVLILALFIGGVVLGLMVNG